MQWRGANQLVNLSADHTPDSAIPTTHCKKFHNDKLNQKLPRSIDQGAKMCGIIVCPANVAERVKILTVNYTELKGKLGGMKIMNSIGPK
jgi:hypothetical protein